MRQLLKPAVAIEIYANEELIKKDIRESPKIESMIFVGEAGDGEGLKELSHDENNPALVDDWQRPEQALDQDLLEKSFDDEIDEKIFSYLEDGLVQDEIAELLEISQKTVSKRIEKIRGKYLALLNNPKNQ